MQFCGIVEVQQAGSSRGMELWARDIEGALCQISVASRDDHLRSVRWPQCPCRRMSMCQVAEVCRRCCSPHLVGCQCHPVCDPLPHWKPMEWS